MTRPDFDTLAVGEEVASTVVTFDRARLVRYAGASGDFNRIHWDETFATDAGLENVIVHGMLTMGAAIAVIEEWAGDPGAVIDYQTRFTRPIPVPREADVAVEVLATVGALDADARTARIDLSVTHDGARVLGKAQVVIRLPASA
jgi:acyl dehydratase